MAGDASLLPVALEEVLRLESPTHAANRDERAFTDADQIDLRRNETRHLAFGQGIHFCLGAALARLEARVAFEELLRHAPHYEIVGEPEPVRSSWALSYARLAIRPA